VVGGLNLSSVEILDDGSNEWRSGPGVNLNQHFTISHSYTFVLSIFSLLTVRVCSFGQKATCKMLLILTTELPFNIGFASMVEDQTGGVILIGGSLSENVGMYDSIFRLSHAEAEWEKLPQKLKLERSKHNAFLIPEEFVNCMVH
jgi:hypothetical protein